MHERFAALLIAECASILAPYATILDALDGYRARDVLTRPYGGFA